MRNDFCTSQSERFAVGRLLTIPSFLARLGIFGTPTYVVNGQIFWGQDRLEYVEDEIAEILAQAKA